MTDNDRDESISKQAPLFGRAADAHRLEQRVELLSDVIGAFAEATTDYDQLLDTIARKLAEVVGDLCSVLLLSDDGNTLWLVSTHDLDEKVLELARATFSGKPFAVVPIQQRVLETGEAYVAPRMTPDRTRHTTTENRANFTEQIGMHSTLLVALRARGVPLGVINLVRHRPDRPPYEDNDRELAQRLADHAAVAIANARLLRQQYEELRIAKENAERANRELEAFSYSAAHDLRAPLRAIDGFGRILIEDHGEQLDDEARRYLERMRDAARRMGQLIEALLNLARINRAGLVRERVDLGELARSIAAGLQEQSPLRTVEWRINDALVADADPRLARIVLENLIGNAWKFTSKQTPARIEIGSEVRDNKNVFFVRDNGAGFDMAHAERLFAPFQRLHADAEFEGTGIGLATVHRIVQRHGGEIHAESRPSQGATFRFTFGRPRG